MNTKIDKMRQIKNVMKKKMSLNLIFLRLGLLFVSISLISCDVFPGMDGIVKDSQTGEVLEGVMIEVTTYYRTINTTTNMSGLFWTTHLQGFGGTKFLGFETFKCDSRFTIRFEKNGYETLEFKENGHHNWIVIELIRIENK